MHAILVAALVGSFALLVTAHLALAYGLLFHRPRWRAAAALVIPPLAPYWGFEAGMKVRFAIWVGALFTYVVVRVAGGGG